MGRAKQSTRNCSKCILLGAGCEIRCPNCWPFNLKKNINIYTYIIYAQCFTVSVSSQADLAQVNIGLRHIFAVELHDQKREYILREHQPEHMFGDISCFSKKSAHCYKCGYVHRILPSTMQVDVYVVGPSYKDMSDKAAHCIQCHFEA